MPTRGETLHASVDSADPTVGDHEQPPTRLPLVVYVMALGTFLMGTTEFMVAGLLSEIAGDGRSPSSGRPPGDLPGADVRVLG
ncbi:hypothetical protein AB5J49_25175 [Streptomyces sp. R28]|uniref:MFS transporter n=1 Tax=Streptomyces sp. R28 TaxID=3238628 RepID=A0AB39Q2A1_9ACTN